MSKSKVRLPRDVRTPYEVYLNGVQQTLGVDFSVKEGSLVFEKELRKDKVSGWVASPAPLFWGVTKR